MIEYTYRKKRLVLIFYIALLLYSLNPDVFERILYFNELFAFIGFLVFIIYFGSKYSDPIYKLVPILLGYLLLFSLYSFFFLKTDVYFFFRHSVLVYSMFSFFLGYHILSRYFDILVKSSENISVLLFANLLSGFMFFRASAVITIPFIFLNRFYSENILHIGIVASLIFASIFYEGTTQLACLLGFIYLIFIPNFRIFVFCSLIMAALMMYIWVDMMSYMNSDVLYWDLHNAFHGTIYAKDGNLLTRILFWYQLVIEHFPNNLIGIGFGNPIYDINKIPIGYIPRPWTHYDYTYVVAQTYLIGGHNSFLYLFTRAGIIPISILVVIYIYIFNKFYMLKKQLILNKRIIFFYAFFIISISAMLNVVLESPIHASLYWILLGTVAHSIIHTQKEIHENFIHS